MHHLEEETHSEIDSYNKTASNMDTGGTNDENFNVGYFKEFGKDRLRLLFQQEQSQGCVSCPVVGSNLTAVKSAMGEIMTKGQKLSFKITTIYNAMVYFCGVVSKLHHVKKTALAMSCLFMISKMEEDRAYLEDLLLEEDLSRELVMDVEKVLLTCHSENLKRITPFDFLPLFSSRFSERGDSNAVTDAQELIFHSPNVFKLIGESPSHVAFAAMVLLEHGRDLKEKFVDDKVDAEGFEGHLTKERVYKCYSLMVTPSEEEEEAFSISDSEEEASEEEKTSLNLDEEQLDSGFSSKWNW